MEPHHTNEASYWNAVAISGLIFGLIVFALSIIGGYMTINAEPTGSMFGGSMVTGLISCLIGAFGGLVAVKLHLGENPQPMLLGRGSVIGLATGVMIALVSTIFGLLWNIIDPGFMDNLIEASIANIEAMNIPEAQKEDMIDSVAGQMQRMKTAGGVLLAFGMNALLYGILNLLTGMLGVKLFASKEDV